MTTMTQTADFPHDLAAIIRRINYKEGWSFTLEDLDRGQGSKGLTFVVKVISTDSYDNDRLRGVLHYFIVPAAAYDERAWMRWVFDQLLLVEQHECCEFFKIDAKRPFAPNHGAGRNPYSIIERGTDADARRRPGT